MELSLKGYIKRFALLLVGLVLCAVGIALTVNAKLGLSPWDMLFDGLSKQFTKILGREVMIGTLSQIIGLMVIVVDIVLKEKIGFGTLLNVWLIGKFTNIFLKFHLLPEPDGLPGRAIVMCAGFIVLGLGIYWYMKSGLGAGPRDSLMIALARRKLPVSLAKNSLEFFAFVVGFFAGGTVGIGTVVAVFAMGYILKYIFKLFDFDMTTVQHESIADTIKNLSRIIRKQNI